MSQQGSSKSRAAAPDDKGLNRKLRNLCNDDDDDDHDHGGGDDGGDGSQ
jgi:hypothetical protein